MQRSSLGWIHRVVAGLTFAALLAVPTQSFAQGCEPIRFSNPSLGAQGESYQEAHQWQLTIGYRRLYSNQWYAGNSGNTSEPHLHIHLMNGPDMRTADGLPLAFSDLVIDDHPVQRAELLRLQRVRPQGH